ncbi:putative manganese exporter [Azospirillaceae bacterium]
MDVFLVSTGTIAIGEIGDKTQLLALLLAARFRKPLPIVLGIFVATVLNHAAAAWAGEWVSQAVPQNIMKWGLGLSFIAMAIWALFPDKADEGTNPIDRFGAFGATAIAFFLVEIGDKTQLATAALAAKFHDLVPVVMGTTLGMMLADAPVVFFGEALARVIPLRVARMIAAGIFFVLGVGILFDLGQYFGVLMTP